MEVRVPSSKPNDGQVPQTAADPVLPEANGLRCRIHRMCCFVGFVLNVIV